MLSGRKALAKKARVNRQKNSTTKEDPTINIKHEQRTIEQKVEAYAQINKNSTAKTVCWANC